MTGNTHVAIGIATSLIVLQPHTIPECLCAITGGMIGGAICDIDSAGKRDSLDIRNDPYGWQIVVFVIIALLALLGLDYLEGNGAVDYIIAHLGIPLFCGAAAFVVLLIVGTITVHRTFMHSILACALFSISLWFFCRPIAMAFALGFISHMVIDFFNKKKVQYFWPIPWRIGLNRFPSDGKLNGMLCAIGALVSFYLSVFLLLSGFSDSVLYTKISGFFMSSITVFGLEPMPIIIPYLIAINIFTFVIYCIDYTNWAHCNGFYSGSDEDASNISEFVLTLFLIFSIAGGMVGMLLAVLIITKGKIYKKEEVANFNMYIIPICLLISWAAFIYTFLLPSLVDWAKPVAKLSVGPVGIPYLLLVYLVIINIITLILFPRVQQFAVVITSRELLCLILCILGGASGTYFSMKSTGAHQNSRMFTASLPFMIIMHAIVITCAFVV